MKNFLRFLLDNKIWWLTPIIILTILFLGLYILGSSSRAYPAFVYSMFQ